jgi:small conductance mechanosensitive channel
MSFGIVTLRGTTMDGVISVLEAPAADVWISELGDSIVTLRLGAWVAQNNISFARARGEAMRLSRPALDAAGIEMPEPTYRLITDGRIAPFVSKQPPNPPLKPSPPAKLNTCKSRWKWSWKGW